MGLLKTYTISTDITGGLLHLNTMGKEIEDSGHITNFSGLLYKKGTDTFDLYGDSFSETDVDAVVLAHAIPNAAGINIEELKEENYNLKGYQKERTFNTLGDINTVTYWENYVDVNNKGDKKVEETRIYTRDGVTGLLEQRTMTHKWYENDVEIATKTTTKYYSSEEGYESNKRAAKNLTRTASMYLVSQIGVANGQAYLDTVVTEISAYEAGSRMMLLNDIAATDFTLYGATDATHSGTIKTVMNVILNVLYT